LIAATPSALSRENLRVEGFAKIGFAEMEELLTTASPEQRERWAQEAGALTDSTLKPIALIAFYTAWLDLKPDEALRSLRTFPDLLSRPGIFVAIRTAVPPTLLPDLIDVIAELSDAERRGVLPPYLATLAQTDPAATARFIDSHPKLVSGSDAEALVSAWAREDIDAATKWLEESQFFTAPTVLTALVEKWLAKDPAAVRDYVLLHRDNQGIGSAASMIANHLLNVAPEQTREFITALDASTASSVLTDLISSVNDERVADLAKLASTLPSAIADDNLGLALARWTYLDPGKALDWVRTKPVTERESLVVQMTRFEIARVSLPEIVGLAYKIRDAEKRDEALSNVVRSLAAETGDAAEEIRALGLSAAQTKHLLELRPKRGE
jgi:hypothetical protein